MCLDQLYNIKHSEISTIFWSEVRAFFMHNSITHKNVFMVLEANRYIVLLSTV